MLTGAIPPTALICGDERGALTAISIAHAMGIAVPEELSIIALAESWLAEVAVPPLTTFAAPVDALAAHAVSALVAQMRGEEWSLTAHSLPTPRLSVRASTMIQGELPLQSVTQ